jgi:Flp pilus assembly protein TadG
MLGLGKFLKNRSGAFAVQFALMVIPLTVCTGLAIDGGRAFLARFELASALDAAALAVGSTVGDNATLTNTAQTFVDANFRTPHNGPISLTLMPGDTLITLKGAVTIDTYFMPLVGQPHVTVVAESDVVRGGANVEVALTLDITGSMSGTKIATLRTAAKDLIDTVVNTTQTPYYSKVSLVPWGPNVHVSSTYANAVRGTVAGPTTVTGAAWQNGTAKTIAAGTGWRVGGAGKTISGGVTGNTWKNGTAATVTKITKVSSNTRIQVTTSANPSYTNGDTVYITGAGGSYTTLNSNMYKVADMTTVSPWTYNLQTIGTSTYVTPPAGSTNSTAGSSQKCFTSACEVQVTATAHGFSNGDFIYISGVTTSGSGTSFNNTAGTSWTIGGIAANTFILTGTNGPGFITYSSSGTASKCYTATCSFKVTTSTAHGFSTGDYIYITGATVANSGTSMVNAVGTTWTIANASGSTFYLPGNGVSYKDWSSGGTAVKCFSSACEVQVTSASHGLAVSDWVQFSGIGGMTSLNSSSTAAWQVKSVSGSNLVLTGTVGPSYTAYTSGGTAQCLKVGCQSYRYTTAGGSTVVRPITNCVSERVGLHQYDDAAPSITSLGLAYGDSTSNAGCETGNPLIPLTADKATLKTAIDAMVVGGSTAGEIGTAWGWYLVSPNFGYLWPNAENRPAAYGTKELVKVVVMMTDGEFNMAHCNGVDASDFGNGNSDRINCNATNGDPFIQARAVCDGMRANKVQVYTVGFELPTSGDSPAFMQYCATDAKHAYLADDPAGLTTAFKSIAKSISKLRISK